MLQLHLVLQGKKKKKKREEKKQKQKHDVEWKRQPEKACFVTENVLITFFLQHLYINYEVRLLPGHLFILSCSAACAMDC